MKKDTFYRDTLTLTAANIATGILGFTFSIILSSKIGPEGMGLYGLIMPIYNLFICIISGGLVTAISKVSAVYYSKHDFRNLNKTIDTTLSFDGLWALIVVSIVFISSNYISTYLIKDSRSLYALKVLCPAMLFIAISSILKGYFYGISKVKIPAYIDVFEKFMRTVVILVIFGTYALSSDISSKVTFAYVALAIGEGISTALLYVSYKIHKVKPFNNMQPSEGRAQLLFNVLVISVPLCLNAFLSTALSTVSTLIVPRRLIAAGMDYSTALSLIGKFTGMSLSIIFFPMVVINSVSTILIPDISKSISNKDYWSTETRVMNVLKIAFLLGLSTLIICNTIPNELGNLLFKRQDLGNFIAISALIAPLVYVSTTTYGILNGLGKQGILLRNSLIISVIELISLYIFIGIPSINIYGFVITFIITSSITLIINMYEIKKHLNIDFNKNNFIVSILLCILFYFILNILKNILPETMSMKYPIITLTGFVLIFFDFKLCKQ